MGARERRSAGRAGLPGSRACWRLGLALAVTALLFGPGQVPEARAQRVRSFNPAPTIDRDRVDRQEAQIPSAPVKTPAPAAKPTVVQPIGEAQGVTLTRIRYQGSSLPPPKLEAATAPFIGKRLTRETLQKIANSISGVYAKSDIAFYSVSVPRQVITGGELLVHVREGRIARYRLLKETSSTPTRLIDAHLDRLMRDRPTHKWQLERTLSLLRDIPGQTVDAQLRTTTDPEELLLDLNVKRHQVDVTLDLNNNGVTNVVSGVQAQLSVAVHGALREGDSTRVSAYLPFHPDRYQFYSLSHTTPIGSNGTMLGVSAAHVRTRTRGTDVRGKATQASIGLSHPLIRSYRRNLSLGASLDGVNSDNYFLDTAFGGFRTRVVRVSANWSVIGKKGGYAVAGTVSQGLDALGARPFAGYSEAAFTKANLQLTAVSEVGKGMAVKLTGRSQFTSDRLPTTERFSLGGEGAGRAFRVGEITAERALAGSLELSAKIPGTDPLAGKVAGAKKTTSGGLTIFAYVDGALAHSIARPRFALPARDYSLASAGGGARFAIGGWEAEAQIAVPVKRPANYLTNSPRFLFSITRKV